MGPEPRRMPKVEFLLIFLLLALFQLAIIYITPAKQYNIFVMSVNSSFQMAKIITSNIQALTKYIYYSYLRLIVGLESFILGIVEFLCWDGIVGLFCVIASIITWYHSVFQLIHHSVHW